MSHSPAEGRLVQLDRLLGREVVDRAGRGIGRLEEFRAAPDGPRLAVTELVIGAAGLVERLGVAVRLVLGLQIGGYLARWDQVDLSDEIRPRLTCPIEDLRRL